MPHACPLDHVLFNDSVSVKQLVHWILPIICIPLTCSLVEDSTSCGIIIDNMERGSCKYFNGRFHSCSTSCLPSDRIWFLIVLSEWEMAISSKVWLLFNALAAKSSWRFIMLSMMTCKAVRKRLLQIEKNSLPGNHSDRRSPSSLCNRLQDYSELPIHWRDQWLLVERFRYADCFDWEATTLVSVSTESTRLTLDSHKQFLLERITYESDVMLNSIVRFNWDQR